MKKILLIALVSAIVFATAACVPSKSSSTNEQQTGTIETTTEAATEETTVEETTVETTEPPAVSPGNFIEGENLKFSFESAKQYDIIQDPDNEFLKTTPSDGKEYLVLFFEVENISSEDQNVNMFYHKAYLDDYNIDQTTLLVKPDGYDILSGNLAPGKKLKGYVCYEVDPNWQKLEFTYTDGISSSAETFDFIVTPEDLS